MGWTFRCDPRFTISDLVRELLTPYHLGNEAVVLDKAQVGNHLWVAVEYTDKEGARKRYIALFLLAAGRGDEGAGYKDLCESSGPCECDCPLRFFDLVPVADGEYAASWRECVRAWHAAKAVARKQRLAMVAGMEVRLAGFEYRLDTLCLSGKGRRASWLVVRLPDGARFRMSARQLTQAIEETREHSVLVSAQQPAPLAEVA